MLLFYDWNNKEYGMKVYKSFDEMRESLKMSPILENILNKQGGEVHQYVLTAVAYPQSITS